MRLGLVKSSFIGVVLFFFMGSVVAGQQTTIPLGLFVARAPCSGGTWFTRALTEKCLSLHIYSSMQIERSADSLYKVGITIVSPLPAPSGSEIENRYCSLTGYAKETDGVLVVFKEDSGGSGEKEPPIRGFGIRISDSALKIETGPEFSEQQYCGLYAGFASQQFLIKDKAQAVAGKPYKCRFGGKEISCF